MLKIVSALKKISIALSPNFFPPNGIHTCSSTASPESISSVHRFDIHSFYNTVRIYSLQSYTKFNNFFDSLVNIFSSNFFRIILFSI